VFAHQYSRVPYAVLLAGKVDVDEVDMFFEVVMGSTVQLA
jgi:hypothetical protein